VKSERKPQKFKGVLLSVSFLDNIRMPALKLGAGRKLSELGFFTSLSKSHKKEERWSLRTLS
jgi:hypothetical protein